MTLTKKREIIPTLIGLIIAGLFLSIGSRIESAVWNKIFPRAETFEVPEEA